MGRPQSLLRGGVRTGVHGVFGLVAHFAHGVGLRVESFFLSFVALGFGEVGLLFKHVFLRFVLLLDQVFLRFLLAFGATAESCERESRSDESDFVELHEKFPFNPVDTDGWAKCGEIKLSRQTRKPVLRRSVRHPPHFSMELH